MAEEPLLAKIPSYEGQNSTEEVEELPLKIPVASLYDHFKCPICLSRISNGCCMTACGHRFCFKCIEEWVDRKHECPCCKSKLYHTSFIKDTGFDALLKTVRKEKEVAEKEYFQRLVNDACEQSFKEDEEAGKTASPLQVVLQKHLKLSMHQHETYHQQLIADYKRGISKISREKDILVAQIDRDFAQSPNNQERSSKLADVESKWEGKKVNLDGELEKMEKLLADTFDSYLTAHLPPPSTIPVNVKLTVPDRKFTSDVLLKPEDSMHTILGKLRTCMEKENMQIIEFPDCEEFEISIISPFAPLDDETVAMAKPEEPGVEDMMTLVSQVNPDCRPVLEFRIKTGTEIRFKGHIVLDSDISNMCFATTFVSGQKKTMNYFICKDCKIKWICHPCTVTCHKSHDVVSFITNHKPAWACCHCRKKKVIYVNVYIDRLLYQPPLP